MGEIAATMLPNTRGQRRAQGALVIHDDGVAFRHKKSWPVNYAWDRIRKIAVENPRRTKANVGALIAFGTLGLGARQSFSLVIVSADDQDWLFESRSSIGVWRATAERIIDDVPNAAGRLFVEGERIGSSA